MTSGHRVSRRQFLITSAVGFGGSLLAISAAAANLPSEDRCYLQTMFSATNPLPPREIARIMGCKVEDVYRLRQRARRWIAQLAERLENRGSCPSQKDEGDLGHGTASTRAI